MRAGEAKRSSITRSRSPAPSPDERSTMRYCMGFVSGTRRLSEKLLHQLQRFTLAPVALAEDPVAHAALGIHHERHRQPSDFPALRGFLLRIEQHRQRHLFALEVFRDLLRKFAEVDGEHFE